MNRKIAIKEESAIPKTRLIDSSCEKAYGASKRDSKDRVFEMLKSADISKG